MPNIIYVGTKPIIKSLDGSQMYAQNLTKAFDGYKTDEDVTLQCQGNVQVKTNKIALLFSSKLFQKIFETNCDSNINLLQGYDIICPDFNPEAMAKVLELINTGTTELSLDVELRTGMISIIQSLQINIQLEPANYIQMTSRNKADKQESLLQFMDDVSDKIKMTSQKMLKKCDKSQMTSPKMAEACDQIKMAESVPSQEMFEFNELPGRLIKLPKSSTDTEVNEIITKLSMPYSCEYCDKRFHLFIDLKQHMKKHQNKSKLYESASLAEQQQEQQMEDDEQEIVNLEDDADIQVKEESSLPCPFCDESFTNLMSYDEHIEKHSDEHGSSQDQIEKTVVDVEASDIEIEMTNKTEKIWLETSGQDLTCDTEQNHGSVSIRCPLCKARKKKFTHLLSHMAACHYKKEISQYAAKTQRKCQMCKIDFRTYSHLMSHLVSGNHNLLDKIVPKEMVETLKEIKAVLNRKPVNKDRKNGLRNIRRRRELIFNMGKDKMDVTDTNKIHVSQILEIPEDETSTRTQSDLEGSSSNGQSYKCPFCPKTETHYTDLQNHVAKEHFANEMSIEKSQGQCYFCGESYKSQDTLVSHIVQKHQFLKKNLSDEDFQKMDKSSCAVLRDKKSQMKYPEEQPYEEGEEDEVEELSVIESPHNTFGNKRLNKILKCPICHCRKPTFSHLKVHIGIVHCKEEVGKLVNRDTLGCNLCPKTFKNMTFVLSHLLKKHTVLNRILPTELLKKLEDMNGHSLILK